MGIRCRRERAGQPARTEDALGQPADHLAPHLARVQEDEVVDDDAILQIAQTVDQFGGVRASTADHGHLCPHAAQRNIRACPTPLPTRRPCSRSTEAARRRTSSWCRGRARSLARARVGPSNHQLVGLPVMVETLGEAVAAVAGAGRAPRAGPGTPALPYRRLLPGRHRPAGRRGDARAGVGRHRLDGRGRVAQRHVRRVACRHVGTRGASVWSAAPGSTAPLSDPMGGPCASRRWPSSRVTSRPAVPGSGCAPWVSRLRAGDGRGAADDAARTGARTSRRRRTQRPCSPASTPAPSPTTACSSSPACSSMQRPTVMPRHAAPPTCWPTRWLPSSAPRSCGSTCTNEPVEVVLGGGIFDTRDTAVPRPRRRRHPRRRSRRRPRPPRRTPGARRRPHRARRDRCPARGARVPAGRLERHARISSPRLPPRSALRLHWRHGLGAVRHGVGHQPLVVGKKRMRELLHHLNDLWVLLRIPTFEQLGEAAPARRRSASRAPSFPSASNGGRIRPRGGAPRSCRRKPGLPRPAQ